MAPTIEFDFKGIALAEQRRGRRQDHPAELDGPALRDYHRSMISAANPLNRVLVAISPNDSEVLYTYDEGEHGVEP